MKIIKIYVLVLLILILVLVIASCKTNRTENFVLENEPPIRFLTLSEAREVFSSDAFAYHKSYSRKESMAKPQLSALPLTGWHEIVRQSYLANIKEFTDDEKRGIHDFIQRYAFLRGQQWTFIKMANHMDFSFPYTLGECIVLPISLVKSIANNRSPRSNFRTLCHENIHILQRSNPQAFREYYESSWNYLYDPQLFIPERLKQNLVINPDGYEREGGWIATVEGREYYYCLCLTDDLKLDKRAYKVIDSLGRRSVDDNQHFPLERFSSYQRGIESCYHPNEEYAYITSERYADLYF